MRNIIFFVILVSFSSFSYSSDCFESVNWTQCTTTNGIESCSAQFKKSNIRAYRGKSQIKAPLENLVSIFLDLEGYPEWQVDLREIKTIRVLSPIGEKACTMGRIEHSFGTKPWMVRWTYWIPNAEFIYKASYEISPDGKQFALHLKSDDNVNIPIKKGYQRGEVQSCYTLVTAPDTQQTSVTAELWVNLNIDIAPSKINASLSKWPNQVIDGLQQYAAKADNDNPSALAKQFLNGCINTQN